MLLENSSCNVEDHLFKVVVIGDSSVGKSNIVMQFTEGKFSDSYLSTIGVDFKMKSVYVDDSKLKFQIWDTAGQERYKTLAQTYYKGACGVILAYSITDESSFENIQKWIKQINQNMDNPGQLVLVGNKIDLEKQRVISWSRGKALADRYSLKFIEVSAKTGENIQSIFKILGAEIMKDLASGAYKLNSRSMKLQPFGTTEEKVKCNRCIC